MHGECEVWYFDASGFCLTPSIPYAWQPLGSVIEVPTSVHNKRINVLGFLTRHNALFPYIIEGRVDTDVVIECFEQFSQHIQKRSYVFLDNASIQKSRAFIQHIPQWVKRGLIIKYLPPYSPELNLHRDTMALHEILLDAVFCLCVFGVLASIYGRCPATFRNGLYH
jgi:transposase